MAKKNDIFNDMGRAATAIEECQIVPQQMKNYTVLALTSVSTLGGAITPMIKDIEAIAQKLPIGKSGKIPKVNRTGGIIKGAAGQNSLLSINPAMLLMAIALVSIDRKLSAIQKTQQEILQFLIAKEKAKMKGNLLTLQGILDEYKFNWDNENFKKGKYVLIQEIKREAEQDIVFYRGRIEGKLAKKSFLQSDRGVKTKLSGIQDEFKDYELALYLFAFSSFLEVMLLENFDEKYLNGVADKVQGHLDCYNNMYQQCYEQIEAESHTSVQARLLGGVSRMSRALGGAIAKFSSSQENSDEGLIEAADKADDANARRSVQIMEDFSIGKCDSVLPFIENIRVVNAIYNGGIDILFDRENIYYSTTD